MYNLQVGSHVFNGQLIVYLMYGIAGWLLLQYMLRHYAERELILSITMNAFWLWLIVWKGSFLIFHLVEFIQLPVSILYFDGGDIGRWMASLTSTAYIRYRSSILNQSLKMWITIVGWFNFAGWFVYHLLLFLFGNDQGPDWFHAVSAGITAAFLIFILVFHNGSVMLKGFKYEIWFSIVNTILLFLVDRPLYFLSFSREQLIFLLLATCLIIYSWQEEKIQKGKKYG